MPKKRQKAEKVESKEVFDSRKAPKSRKRGIKRGV